MTPASSILRTVSAHRTGEQPEPPERREWRRVLRGFGRQRYVRPAGKVSEGQRFSAFLPWQAQRFHQRRMERTGNIQFDSALSTGSQTLFHGFLNSCNGTGNHDLPRSIEVNASTTPFVAHSSRRSSLGRRINRGSQPSYLHRREPRPAFVLRDSEPAAEHP